MKAFHINCRFEWENVGIKFVGIVGKISRSHIDICVYSRNNIFFPFLLASMVHRNEKHCLQFPTKFHSCVYL